MPSGWPSAIAPPFGFHVRCVVREAELAKHRKRLRGEGFVDLDNVHISDA
jgi:hypothetical protein